jgi:hypothetical protein
VNLQQHVLDKSLAIPRIKKKGRRNQSFTGGDEFATAAAGTRGGAPVELVLKRVRWCAEKAKARAGA